MGKKSKYPEYTTGNVTINGRNVASVTKDSDGNISGNYNRSQAEEKLFNNIQSNLSNSVQNLFNISDQTKKQWTDQLNAYKRKGIQAINDIYSPMETSLKNDVASRFGNLDNSVFLDNLRKITDKKSDAVAQLSNNLLLQKNSLYSQEMQNRINYISLLSGLSDNMDNRALTYMNQALQHAESGNSHNNRAYQANSSSGGGLLGMNIGSSLGLAGSMLANSNPGAAAAMSAFSFL